MSSVVFFRGAKGAFYPNDLVEKTLGVPATTRTWNTILKIRDILRRE